MGKLIDITGKRYGRLQVIEYIGQDSKRNSLWKCLCDCGNYIVVPKSNLIKGNTKSCGCLGKENLKQIGKNNKKYNQYDLTGEYGIGYTFTNEPFYFDLEDYELIKNYCWHKSKANYIITDDKNKSIIFLHKLVMHTENEVDHIDRNKSNARKNNLRECTHSENMRNVGIKRNNSSGYIGVTYDKSKNKWVSNITVNKKHINKCFNTKEEAIKYRLYLEKEYFGEFAPQKYLFEQYGIVLDED